MKWQELAVPENIKSIIIGARAFKSNTNLRVMLSRDADRWHISVSLPDRYPNWDEIKEARYKFIPNDVFMIMGLPPKEYFINVHENCFHLWEMKDQHLIEIMRNM